MADLKETDSTPTPIEAPVIADVPDTKKKAPKPRKARASPRQPKAKGVAKASVQQSQPDAPAKKPRKVHSEQERAQILARIDKALGRKGAVKKAVITEAGISEQTYYQWKKAAASPRASDDLKDLVALEDENKRLKSLLAQRLRRENAELKKKLGLS